MPSSRAESINCRSALADRKLVPDDQIGLFCEILQFRHEYGEHYNTEEGREIYCNRLRPLVPKLKFPLSNNPGFAWKLILPKQSEYCHLCDLHKGLNADFVHQWFKFLALEVGARLEVLRASGIDYVGDYAWNHVVKPLTRLHKIWETKERIVEAFGDFTDAGFREKNDLLPIERQHDACEACILARIGSHEPTLFALRAAVKSRITLESSLRHPSRLRLLRLIEPWIKLHQAHRSHKFHSSDADGQMLLENTRLAKEIYPKRRQMEIYQHELERYGISLSDCMRSAGKHDTGEEEWTKDVFYEAEHDIIDSYAALRATQRQSQLLKSFASKQKDRKSTPSETGERSLKTPKVDTAYRESRYSIDTVCNNERVIEGPSALVTDSRAATRCPNQTDSVQTTWDDIIAGGSGMGSPFVQAPSLLAGSRIVNNYNDNLSSQRRCVRETVWEDIPVSEYEPEYKS